MRRFLWTGILILALALSGCGSREAQLPADWDSAWTVVAPSLAVEPVEGFALHEQNDALYLSGIYYATWVTGEGREHTNEEGESAQVFDGQIYVLLQQLRSPDAAETELAAWIAREKQTYETGEGTSALLAGQEFTLLPLHRGSGQNPYTGGMAAFGVRGDWAICVELVHGDGFAGDPRAILEAFLSGFHYND